MHGRNPDEGVSHSLTAPGIVLVSHHEGRHVRCQVGKVIQGVGISHPDEGDAFRFDVPTLQRFDKGGHAIGLKAKIPRRPVAHLRGCDNQMVGTLCRVLHFIPSQARSVFAQNMAFHIP